MGTENSHPQDEQTEQSIVSVSAKIADALEMVRKAKVMTTVSENVLIQAQLELEEICVKLKDGPDEEG